jgi:nucleoid-associated protein YgaU
MSAVTLLLIARLLAASDAPETIEHIVQPGETLWSIAAQTHVYGDPYLWPVIYKFNRDQIKDPSRIYPSQRLQIPIRLEPDARSSARLEAGASARSEGAGP